MHGKTTVVHTMSEMCYYVYVCMVRQQWYILLVKRAAMFMYA